MADDNIELAPAPAGMSKKKVIVILAAAVLVAVGGTLGGLFAMGILPPKAPEAQAEAAEPVEEPPEEAVYIALDPPFTVNFAGQGSTGYLQLSLQAMTRDPDIEDQVMLHLPVIRNDLMLLFGSKSSSELASREGKEALQAEVLASIQGVLERETGAPGVEAVYFTSFVMQ